MAKLVFFVRFSKGFFGNFVRFSNFFGGLTRLASRLTPTQSMRSGGEQGLTHDGPRHPPFCPFFQLLEGD